MCNKITLNSEGGKNKDYFLWKRFIDGDDKAFFLIYDQYFDTLYNYGIHFSKNNDLIKDCIHDLFLDLYKYRTHLAETDSIQFYLFRSLRRLIYKEQSKNVTISAEDKLLMQNDVTVMAYEDAIIASETKDANHKILFEVMKDLSDRQREGLSLKFEQNFSYKEIADILDISVESARTNIYRALKDLRKALKKKGISVSMLFLLLTANNLISPEKQPLTHPK